MTHYRVFDQMNLVPLNTLKLFVLFFRNMLLKLILKGIMRYPYSRKMLIIASIIHKKCQVQYLSITIRQSFYTYLSLSLYYIVIHVDSQSLEKSRLILMTFIRVIIRYDEVDIHKETWFQNSNLHLFSIFQSQRNKCGIKCFYASKFKVINGALENIYSSSNLTRLSVYSMSK